MRESRMGATYKPGISDDAVFSVSSTSTKPPVFHHRDRRSSFDRQMETREQRLAFFKVRNAERDYARRLAQVAKQVDTIVKEFKRGDRIETESVVSMLHRYAALLDPWARSVAERMIADVNRRDERAWFKHAEVMGVEMRNLLKGPTGQQLRAMLESQVDLITSLPREAAQRVHDISVGNLYAGTRGESLVAEILRTGLVTRSRAETIARTEVARTGSNLTQIRATNIGSTHYIWRAAFDRRVRPSHKRMNGRTIAWDDPPVVDVGVPPYHAGCIYNCRCYAEPIINL